MTNKEYLHQAYRLDHKINSDIAELKRLREMSGNIAPQQSGDRVKNSRSGDAPFVRSIEKIMLLERQIDHEIDSLVDLKEQMRGVIGKVQNTDEQMVLRYRYIHNMTWEEIGDELNADKSTVRRWHRSALADVVLPENPINISEIRPK